MNADGLDVLVAVSSKPMPGNNKVRVNEVYVYFTKSEVVDKK